MTPREKDLLDRMAVVVKGKRFAFPDLCGDPLERLQIRLTHFNQFHIYKRNCSATGKSMLSMYHPENPFPVYDNDYWWSDSWDGVSYGRELDFSRTFFEQYRELRDTLPHLARFEVRNQNCKYVNNADNNKNGYLIFNTTTSEDCMYGENVSYSRDVIDCTQSQRCELCYECTLCTDCYELRYSENCQNCQESAFLLNCRSCSHCFACVNLYRKKYCIFNKQYTKENYEAFFRKIDLSQYSTVVEQTAKFKVFSNQFPRPHVHVSHVENASGTMLENARDIEDSYLIFGGAENLVRCLNLGGSAKDCLEHSAFGLNVELCYQCVRCGIDLFNLRFCLYCIGSCSDLIYCSNCRHCEHCFGCVNLRRKKYCIFNVQYSEKDYFTLLPKVINWMQETGEWGKFFPPEISAIAYNHSLAQRYFPLRRSEAVKHGYSWYEPASNAEADALAASKLPEGLPAEDLHLKVLSQRSHRPFLVTSQEIARYRKLNVPLPRLHFEERIEDRALSLGGVSLYKRHCDKTAQEIRSVYPADAPFPVWERNVFEQEFFS